MNVPRFSLFHAKIHVAKFAEAVLPGLQQLNRYATVSTEQRPTEELPDTFFRAFTAVLLTQCNQPGDRFNERLCDVPSIHFPLSATFVSFRLLLIFRSAGLATTSSHSSHLRRSGVGRAPVETDYARLLELSAAFLAQQGVPGFLDEYCIKSLSICADTVSVCAASVGGSFLAQEVVKALSQSGCPAANVFVFSCDDMVAKAFPVKQQN
ncbi:unnamed protein product [Sphagnum jensenii]